MCLVTYVNTLTLSSHRETYRVRTFNGTEYLNKKNKNKTLIKNRIGFFFYLLYQQKNFRHIH